MVSPKAAPHSPGTAEVALPRGTSKEVAAPGTTRAVLHSHQHGMASPTSPNKSCHHCRSPQRAELSPNPEQVPVVLLGPPSTRQDAQCLREAKPCCCNHVAELQPPPHHTHNGSLHAKGKNLPSNRLNS